jgi:hypothetical protein
MAGDLPEKEEAGDHMAPTPFFEFLNLEFEI